VLVALAPLYESFDERRGLLWWDEEFTFGNDKYAHGFCTTFLVVNDTITVRHRSSQNLPDA
jgi:hypothetical protein